jgi:2-haloacid dehalogenase
MARSCATDICLNGNPPLGHLRFSSQILRFLSFLRSGDLATVGCGSPVSAAHRDNGGTVFASRLTSAKPAVSGISPIKAVAFDAFAIFDPRPVFAMAEQMFPSAGLSEEWRTRQFEYCWLRVCSGRYADFWQVTRDPLVFAARKLRLDMSASDRERLLNAYLQMSAWPDVRAALEPMKSAGLRLALLSNFTPEMLDANVSGLAALFDAKLSTDRENTYKPDPRAYRLGLRALKLRREETLFVAFAGWDADGAKQFGYPTYWLNRQQLPPEEMGVLPDASSDTLGDLTTLLA